MQTRGCDAANSNRNRPAPAQQARLADVLDRVVHSAASMRQSVLFLLTLAFVAGCSSSPPSEFRPTSTVKDIMDSVIDPSADVLWDSVEVIATLEGTERKAPRTDDDWKVLRRHAVALAEASNLLLIPGRHVARPGEKPDDARVELQPQEIEALLGEGSGCLGVARAWFARCRHRVARGGRGQGRDEAHERRRNDRQRVRKLSPQLLVSNPASRSTAGSQRK